MTEKDVETLQLVLAVLALVGIMLAAEAIGALWLCAPLVIPIAAIIAEVWARSYGADAHQE